MSYIVILGIAALTSGLLVAASLPSLLPMGQQRIVDQVAL